MKLLVIGNGGREHALAWKLAQSPKVTKVYVAPGNAGTALENKVENIAIQPTDIAELMNFCQQHIIAFTVVGPELPLSLGIVDAFQRAGLACVGPTQFAAQLESSKSFCKDFLRDNHIPTANYAVFTEHKVATDYLRTQTFPIVIKADGLAAGKGVVIAQTLEQALQTLDEFFTENSLGEAGHKVVIEEFLHGEEASFIVATDGKSYQILASAQDHKARDDGDQGPNTGGMGAYSPAPIINEALQQKILAQVIEPTLKGMAALGHDYQGFLYAGLMITPQGEPKVLEFNCRLGDPETQVILLRLKSDLVELCEAIVHQTVARCSLQWHSKKSVGVVMAAGGYPANYRKGDVISGFPALTAEEKIFHAGTTLQNKNVITQGGRVLCVCVLGDTVMQAQQQAYALVRQIHWSGCFYRKDIGYKAIAREKI